MEAFSYEKDKAGIITLTLDMPGRSTNVINDDFATIMTDVMKRLEAEEDWQGMIITSAKKTFIAGGDIDMLYQATDAATVFQKTEALKAMFRRWETLGKPIVAAINGACLGGGLELALACHYRIAHNHRGTRIGLPEVTLGLIPGGGGITKVVRLLGLEAALPLLTKGKQLPAAKAAEIGLIDAVVDNKDDMIRKAKAWITSTPEAQQPWDVPRYKIPGGTPQHPKLAAKLPAVPAMTTAKTFNNYPAINAILAAAVEGTLVDFDTAMRIESRYFAKVVVSQAAKNMMTAFWYQRNKVLKGGSRPEGIPPTSTQRVGIIGAGRMGHGIAYVTAKAGMEVVMKDIDLERAEAGKEQIALLLQRAIAQGRMNEARKNDILERIQTTADAADFSDCDLVIEAVFEHRELKAIVTQEAEEHLLQHTVIGSNTSSLPISGLAKASQRPGQFIGIHFFSPVHRMELVEIIKGAETTAETLAKAFDYVLAIGKIPIVVNDSRGFFTSRCFSAYGNEGLALLQEGQSPASIEKAGKMAGMPMGPLEVLDSVGLKTALSIREQHRKDMIAAGKEADTSVMEKVLHEVVRVHERGGKADGAGFYHYKDGKKTELWEGLQQLFPTTEKQLDVLTLQDRLMFSQVLEAAKCIEEGVVENVADANIGSIFGWGFAPFQGGVLQFINAYGINEFVDRAMQLSVQFGERFSPCSLLFDMMRDGKKF